MSPALSPGSFKWLCSSKQFVPQAQDCYQSQEIPFDFLRPAAICLAIFPGHCFRGINPHVTTDTHSQKTSAMNGYKSPRPNSIQFTANM